MNYAIAVWFVSPAKRMGLQAATAALLEFPSVLDPHAHGQESKVVEIVLILHSQNNAGTNPSYANVPACGLFVCGLM